MAILLLLLSASAALVVGRSSSVETQCSSDAAEPEDEFALMQTYHDIRRKSFSALSLRSAVETEGPSYGLSACPCVGIDWPKGETVVLNFSGAAVSYPLGMGSSCQAWDAGRHPSCTGSSAPSWCADAWCFVDACKCNISSTPKTSSYLPNSAYQGRTLYYSYATCGAKDPWTSSNHATACANQATQTQCSALSKCAWTGTTCVGKEVASCGSKKNELVLGKSECRCIGFTNISGDVAANTSSFYYPYPAEVGSYCSAWDSGRNPSCTGNSPAPWCADKWCYVDACSCNLGTVPKKSTYFAGASYQGRPLFYSYAACGVKDAYTAAKNMQACPNFNETACSQQSHCVWGGVKGCMSKDIASYCAAPGLPAPTPAAANASASLPPPPPAPSNASQNATAPQTNATVAPGNASNASNAPNASASLPPPPPAPSNASQNATVPPTNATVAPGNGNVSSASNASNTSNASNASASLPPLPPAPSNASRSATVPLTNVTVAPGNASNASNASASLPPPPPPPSNASLNASNASGSLPLPPGVASARPPPPALPNASEAPRQASATVRSNSSSSQSSRLKPAGPAKGSAAPGEESAPEGYTPAAENYGLSACPCIGIDWPAGETIPLNLTNKTVSYPLSMGSSCQAWDAGRHPTCRGSNPPAWCLSAWCLVDACNCNISSTPKISTYLANSTYQGRTIYYSYATCGSQDIWTSSNHATACVNQANKNQCEALSKCAWTGTKCVGKEVASCGSQSNELVLGKAECRCIGFANISGSVSAGINGTSYNYPAEVGSYCSPWDSGRHPSCTGNSMDPWCKDSWCYVDPCSCDLATVPKKLNRFAGASYQGRPLFYSYAACGVQDKFTGAQNTQACTNFATSASCTQQSQCAWTSSKGCMSKDIVSYCGAPSGSTTTAKPPATTTSSKPTSQDSGASRLQAVSMLALAIIADLAARA